MAEWAAGPPLYSQPAAQPRATRCGGDRSLLRGAGRSREQALRLRPPSAATVGPDAALAHGLRSGKSRLGNGAGEKTLEKGRRPALWWGRGAAGPGTMHTADRQLWPTRQFTGNRCACRSCRCLPQDKTLPREGQCSPTKVGASQPQARRAGDWLARLGSRLSTPGGSTDSVPAEMVGGGEWRA